ncbi:MAG: 3-phenylpropionate/cinnamic acid dioxygenase subunit beta [Janthinobacterium lividum]
MSEAQSLEVGSSGAEVSIEPVAVDETLLVGDENDVPVGSAVYNELLGFLYREAAMLDTMRIQEWSTLLAEDLSYTAPIRINRNLADIALSVSPVIRLFDDTYVSMMGRVGRLTQTKSAFAEDPPSRTRRFVTNMLASRTGKPDEFEVVSYLYVTRSRFENPAYQVVTCERHDLLRRNGRSFKIARREIIVDQSTMGMSNLAIFL